MDTSHGLSLAADAFPGLLTPEKVRKARERTAAIHEDLRRQGVDFARLPNPVEELIKAREAGYREP
jgi:hypothetical protein